MIPSKKHPSFIQLSKKDVKHNYSRTVIFCYAVIIPAHACDTMQRMKRVKREAEERIR